MFWLEEEQIFLMNDHDIDFLMPGGAENFDKSFIFLFLTKIVQYVRKKLEDFPNWPPYTAKSSQA